MYSADARERSLALARQEAERMRAELESVGIDHLVDFMVSRRRRRIFTTPLENKVQRLAMQFRWLFGKR